MTRAYSFRWPGSVGGMTRRAIVPLMTKCRPGSALDAIRSSLSQGATGKGAMTAARSIGALFSLQVVFAHGAAAADVPEEEPIWSSTVPVSYTGNDRQSRDVVTQVISNSTEGIQFEQATSDDIYRTVTITLAPSAGPKASNENHQVVLDDGRRFLVQRPSVSTVPAGPGYAISFDFYLPHASLRPDLGRAVTARDEWSPGALVRLLGDAIVATAVAQGNSGWAGSFTDVKTQLGGRPSARRDIRYEARRAMEEAGRPTGGYCLMFELNEAKDWVRRIREINQQLSELGEGRLQQSQLDANPAYREARSRRDALMAEDRAARARIAADAARRRSAEAASARGRSSTTSSLDAMSAYVQLNKIADDKRAFKERVAALRRCHQNPTEPTAIKAKNVNDPGYQGYQAVNEALDAVDLQIDIESEMREAASSINTVAATGLAGVGAAVTGILGEIEDGLLRQSMEEAIASIEKCIVRCRPCESDAATAAAAHTTVSAGLPPPAERNFTPGLEQNFTPGPAGRVPSIPTAEVCRPPVLEGRLSYVVHEAGWLMEDVQWRQLDTTTVVNARLRPVPDEPGQYEDDGSTFHFGGTASGFTIGEDGCQMLGGSSAAESGDFLGEDVAVPWGRITDDGRLALDFSADIEARNIHSWADLCGVAGTGQSDSYSAGFNPDCWGEPVQAGQPGHVHGRRTFQFSCHSQAFDATGILSESE
jgi:hypothetical protein